MKRFLATTLFLLTISLTAMAQGKVYTKRGRLEGFQNKTVKVVLPGPCELTDAIRRSVSSGWIVSPFEFCDEKEYQRLKGDSHFFFLKVKPYESDGVQEKILCLDYSQGGGNDQESLKAAFQVLQVPISSGADTVLTERELACIPAMVDIVQRFALEARESDRVAYAGLSIYSRDYSSQKGFRVFFCKDDLSEDVKGGCVQCSAEDCITLLEEMRASSAVSLVIAPSDPQKGDWCYKMVIGTDNHKMYYFYRDKIKNPRDVGMEASDVRFLVQAK